MDRKNTPTNGPLGDPIKESQKPNPSIKDVDKLSDYGFSSKWWWYFHKHKANLIFILLVAAISVLIYFLQDLIRHNKCSANKGIASAYLGGIALLSFFIYKLIWPYTQFRSVNSSMSKMIGYNAIIHQQKLKKKAEIAKLQALEVQQKAAQVANTPPVQTYNYSYGDYTQQPTNNYSNKTYQQDQQKRQQEEQLQREALDRQRQQEYQQKRQQQEQQEQQQKARNQQWNSVNKQFQQRQQSRQPPEVVIAPVSLTPLNKPTKAEFIAQGLSHAYEKETQQSPPPVEQTNQSSWWSPTTWLFPEEEQPLEGNQVWSL